MPRPYSVCTLSDTWTPAQKTEVTHPLHLPLDRPLLRRDETLDRGRNGAINVILSHKVPQVHPGKRLRHTDDGFQITHRDGDTACELRLKRESRNITEQMVLAFQTISRVYRGGSSYH